MPQFASVDDYYEYMGKTAPVLETDAINALNSLLRRASDRIARLTSLARYRVAYDGSFASASVAEAFARATAAQAIHMRQRAEEGDESSAAGWDSISLIGVAFSRNTGSSASSSGLGEGGRYSADAVDILATAGISSTVVSHPGY